MPVESRDDLVTRDEMLEALANQRRALCAAHDEDRAELKRVREYAAKRIAELEAERDEARLLVTEANNSLFGSQGYFYSLNGGPFDKYHLSRAIEDLKERARRAIAAERALAEERERHQWRTIDSAPTNGDTFLAWEGSERGPFKCWWRDDWPYDESCWMDPQDSEPAPTHWKPLDIPDATAIRSGKTDGKDSHLSSQEGV